MNIAANNLVKEFCQSIGMEALGLDSDNQRSLAFDDKLVVTFIGGDNDFVTALCFIADSAGHPEVFRKVLEQNFLSEAHGGGRFSLEPTSDRIILTRHWNAVKTTVPEFSDELEAFVNSGMQAQDFINNVVAGVAPPAAKTEQGAPVDTLAAAYQAI
jgi:hypothetical protein